jgi:hypothetical protein
MRMIDSEQTSFSFERVLFCRIRVNLMYFQSDREKMEENMHTTRK